MQTIIGAFEDRQAAQSAVQRLVDAGFDRDDVHVQEGASTTGSTGSSTDTRGDFSPEEDRGFLASIGHFFSSLFGEDNPHPTGRSAVYSEAVRRGTSMVVVDANDEEQADRAAALLHELGAVDVDERAEQWRQSGWTGYSGYGDNQPLGAERSSWSGTGETTGTPSMTGTPGSTGMLSGTSDSAIRTETTGMNDRTDLGDRADLTGRADLTDRTGIDGQQKLDVVQEEIQVGKRAIDRGGVRVIQRVSETPVRELVFLREERAIVDRQAVDRPANQGDLTNFQDQTIEVREMSEEPVVAKTARVVEEVRVGKDVQEREQTVEDSVRRKDVDVERIEGQGRVEQERAFASDRTTTSDPIESRDPDGVSDVTRERKTLTTRKDKPTR